MTNPEVPQPEDVDTYETGDPNAIDTGDILEAPEEVRGEIDDDPPNADVDDTYDDVSEGTVVTLDDDEDDDSEDGLEDIPSTEDV